MTIDEAIEHAEWCADHSCGECADEHRQLAEWLKELRQWKELVEGIDLRPESLMKPFRPNDLEAENDRLKRFAKLDENTISALNACIDDLNVVNFRLRELVRDMWEYVHIGTAEDGQSLHDRTLNLGIEV